VKVEHHRIWLALAIASLAVQGGCVRSPDQSAGSYSAPIAHRRLSATEAAALAASLANEQCEHQYHRRPFTAERYDAVFENGLYRWGRLDPGGPAGFSAIVTFREDGSKPHVEVHYSSDTL
jgi:hypothetical protein